MPKLMLNSFEKTDRQNNLSTKQNTVKSKRSFLDDPKERERLLRKKRSESYLDILTKLDTGNVDIEDRIEAILNEIQKEFPLIEIPGDFIGYCSKCYLGDDYEVHMVDFSEKIIEHYKVNIPMPNGMEKARYIAMNENYRLIEVYTNCIRAIDHSGNVSVIEC